MQVVAALDVGLDFVHGGYPLPGFGWIVEIWVEIGKARLVAGPSLFALLFNFTGLRETHLPSKCGGYVAGGVWVGEFSTGLGG